MSRHAQTTLFWILLGTGVVLAVGAGVSWWRERRERREEIERARRVSERN